MLELTIGSLVFVLAIVFVAFMTPKRTDEPPKPSAKASDENKKDSDSASDSSDK